MSSLEGYTIAITGGGSGIGLATTVELCSRGATVWIAELTPDVPTKLESLVHAGKVVFRGGVDVASREACVKFLGEVVEKAGRLDGMINNAGIGPAEGPIATDETFEKIVGVNLRGTWNYGTQALRIMEKQEPKGQWGTKGTVVNVASMSGLLGWNSLAVYTATKHAVVGLVKAWCKDFAPLGIRVNAVAPSVTETEGVKIWFAQRKKDFNEDMKPPPVGRFAQPSEIAKVIAFLVGEDSSYINGQTIPINGGAI
ncbi:uncharacterized protein Z519_09694 [Cladophialophora bantiana CBS 173.52]|uniref:3-oxoacyl-[acyl-carrier protein] reductase n=1 Tax=Cladophialophora bantiana (strain ATCC 10958 / CBS 173.52 / CDC B-1940 / NIH 8579) TaxID=1442370 RepID=A0A0D2H8J4_CLAB1|nr:uncharacterized protein Z519_09694 [Cladophialophora bantiana CBS 173.52]KIW89538.1 hypothetical protein Z519_09694 [Cladophialophora bantiana CBS 173.52]